ncbi:MAG: DUF4982 domain-containing protein [Lachnospiraceae bacterium]|nr:DUF4982 domain-containing protein [Lachnospiraceae bacterium]
MRDALFTDGWSFAEFPVDTPVSDMFDSKDLYPVTIPHDWQIWHSSDLYRDSFGFYRKTFFLHAAKDHTYIIRFEGVYMDSEIYLNGNLIFTWKYGYSTFDVDLTDHLVDGENVLCVKCTYLSPNTRWYSGAGIYRKILFYDFGPAYIPLDGIYVSMEKEGEDFNLTIDTETVTKVTGKYSVRNTLLDNSGAKVSNTQSVIPHPENNDTLHIISPRLWDVKDPYFYNLRTELCDGETVVDSVDTRVGFEILEFDADIGFFLNGQSLKIQGVCMHHDLGALGSAVNKTALRRQLMSMQEMGVNAIRTSHNMPSTELLDLCDEMGFLVYDEAFDMWENHKTEHDYATWFDDWYRQDVASWIRRDRNRPCLFLWGIGNEISDSTEEKGLKIAKNLRDEIKKHDRRHNAFITIASNGMYSEWAHKIADELDLTGYNYGEHFYDKHHKEHPAWKIFGSETASTLQSRGIYHFPFSNRLLTHEDGQCSSLDNCTTNWGAKNVDYVIGMHRDRGFAWGQFLWTGWDYIGEPTPYDAMGCRNSYFGQVDTAGFKKDSFYHYQAEWTDVNVAPMVHLLPYWDFNEGQEIDILAYSNAPYVELFFNGKSQGRQFIDHAHGERMCGHWVLKYAPGELKVNASLEDGTVVAVDSTRSFTDPVALCALPDKETIKADGEDLVFIEVSSIDKEGNFVANARNRVKVTLEGPGILMGVDNGDSTDFDEYKGNSRRLFSGRMLAIIAATGEGEIRVKFESEGLTGAEVICHSAESSPEGNVLTYNPTREANSDPDRIPVRKIVLSSTDSHNLGPDCREARVEYRIYPEYADYGLLVFKALTENGVEANFADLVADDPGENSKSSNSGTIRIRAIGDGNFRLTAYAYDNSSDKVQVPKVLSELTYSISGLGKALRNPYSFVPGCEYASIHSGDSTLSFEGGVFVKEGKRAYITFDNLDFGMDGSDEITIPIFTFKEEMPVEILEGDFETGTTVFSGTYEAKSIYNVYQTNTFKLNKKIRGTKTITLIFDSECAFSLKGFIFT